MAASIYCWAAVGEFHNRTTELAVLESWWDSSERQPISPHGRRRVGKSWLFRKLAHGKPSIILVADQSPPTTLFRRFAAELEPALGLRPQIDSIADLFTALYRAARDQKVLVAIDEFPYLLGSNAETRRSLLTQIQAVMEAQRDNSRIKLILTGSAVSTMEQLGEYGSPLHGRLRQLTVSPLWFEDARAFLPDTSPDDALTRYAISGGTPWYLSVMAEGELANAVATNLLDRHGPLVEEPIRQLSTELAEPAIYSGILSALAGGALPIGEIGERLGLKSTHVSSYLSRLSTLRIIEQIRPVGVGRNTRRNLWACSDPFMRFWFRFTQPHLASIEAGTDPLRLYRSAVLPHLASHVADVFEDQVRRWIRLGRADVDIVEVGRWWGNSLHSERRAGRRTTEEIDAVGLMEHHVSIVAEAKWTTRKLDYAVVRDLYEYKLPALEQAGFDISSTQVVLASRTGFKPAVEQWAADHHEVSLITATELLNQLG